MTATRALRESGRSILRRDKTISVKILFNLAQGQQWRVGAVISIPRMKKRDRFFLIFSAISLSAVLLAGFIDYQNQKEIRDLQKEQLRLQIEKLKYEKYKQTNE